MFKVNVYDNILEPRCSSCHKSTAGRTPATLWFAGDLSTEAYPIASNSSFLFNLDDPGSSRVVTFVAGGHQCWTQGDCAGNAAALSASIQAWKNAIDGVDSGGGGGTVIQLDLVDQLVAPADITPSGSTPYPEPGSAEYTAILNAYSGGSNLHNLLTTYCVNCHVNTSPTPQPPYFAVADAEQSMNTLVETQKIDLANTNKSTIYTRLKQEGHQ